MIVVVGEAVVLVASAAETTALAGAFAVDVPLFPQLASTTAKYERAPQNQRNEAILDFTTRWCHAFRLAVERSKAADLILHNVGRTSEKIANDRRECRHMRGLEVTAESSLVIPVLGDDERVRLTNVFREPVHLATGFRF